MDNNLPGRSEGIANAENPVPLIHADMIFDLGVLYGYEPFHVSEGGCVRAFHDEQIEYNVLDELIVGVRCFKVIDKNSFQRIP